MHAFILFSVLSALFLLVISKVERDALETEIQKLLQDKFIPQLNKAPRPELELILNRLDFDELEAYYSRASDKVAITNKWLTITMILVIVFLFSTLVITSLLRRDCISFGGVLGENILIFSLVGLFEYQFFKMVASKYIPVKPSVIESTLKDNLFVNK
jgi:hypothetical protein